MILVKVKNLFVKEHINILDKFALDDIKQKVVKLLFLTPLKNTTYSLERIN